MQKSIKITNKESVKDIVELSFCLNENELMNLSFWLNAKIIASHVSKTEVILFKTRYKIMDTEMKLDLCRKLINFLSELMKI